MCRSNAILSILGIGNPFPYHAVYKLDLMLQFGKSKQAKIAKLDVPASLTIYGAKWPSVEVFSCHQVVLGHPKSSSWSACKLKQFCRA